MKSKEFKVPRGFLFRMNEIKAPKVCEWRTGKLSLNQAVRGFIDDGYWLLVHKGRAIVFKEREK